MRMSVSVPARSGGRRRMWWWSGGGGSDRDRRWRDGIVVNREEMKGLF